MPPKAKKDNIYDQYFSITKEYIDKYYDQIQLSGGNKKKKYIIKKILF